MIPLIENENFEISKENFYLEAFWDLPDKMILPMKSYLSLFPRYCEFFHDLPVTIKFSESNEGLHIGLIVHKFDGINHLRKFSKIFKNYIQLILISNPFSILKFKYSEPKNTQQFHKVSMLIEESVRHFNRLVYLEYNFNHLLELPVSKNVFKGNEVDNYQDVSHILMSKDMDKIMKENDELRSELKRYREEVKTIEKDKKSLSIQVNNLINKYIKNQFNKDELIELFRKNSMQKIFQVFYFSEEIELRTEMILLENQYNDYNRSYNAGTIDPQFYYEKITKIKSNYLG